MPSTLVTAAKPVGQEQVFTVLPGAAEHFPTPQGLGLQGWAGSGGRRRKGRESGGKRRIGYGRKKEGMEKESDRHRLLPSMGLISTKFCFPGHDGASLTIG